jgi:hypothetical protein
MGVKILTCADDSGAVQDLSKAYLCSFYFKVCGFACHSHSSPHIAIGRHVTQKESPVESS